MHALADTGSELFAVVRGIVRHISAHPGDCEGEQCFGDALARELRKHEIPFQRGVWVPERQAGLPLNCGQVIDFVVDGRLAAVVSQSFGNEHAAEARLVHGMRLLGLAEGLLVAVDSGGQAEVRRLEYR